MDNPPSQKKGIGALGWLGIGCGGVVFLAIIAVIVSMFFFKDWFVAAAKNPTRAGASAVVNMGLAEWVTQDDEKKIYTIKQKADGKMITFYWSKKKNNVDQVSGDASAIPEGDLGVPPSVDLSATPGPATPEPAPR
jgi:hypothetical protein